MANDINLDIIRKTKNRGPKTRWHNDILAAVGKSWTNISKEGGDCPAMRKG